MCGAWLPGGSKLDGTPRTTFPGESMIGRENAKANFEKQTQENKTRASLRAARGKERELSYSQSEHGEKQ